MTKYLNQIRESRQIVLVMAMASAIILSHIDKRTKRGKAMFEMQNNLMKEYSITAEAIGKLDPAQEISSVIASIMISMLKTNIQIMLSNPYNQPTNNRSETKKKKTFKISNN